MSKQQTNREVREEADRFNATYQQLQAELRAAGIRNVHTSPKARKLIERGATAQFIDRDAIAEEMKRRHGE